MHPEFSNARAICIDPSNARTAVGEGTPSMLSVSSLSVLSKFATVKVSSGAAIPSTALLIDAMGLKVNELDGSPEGPVGWFDGSSLGSSVGSLVGSSVGSLVGNSVGRFFLEFFFGLFFV